MKNSGTKRIAERYVRALFDVAQAARAVDAVEKDLAALEKLLEDNTYFQHFLTSPLLGNDARDAGMLAVLAKINAQELTRQFIAMLIRQKRLAVLPDIAALFGEWAAAARGELRGEIVASAPLKEQNITLISDTMGRAYGKKMQFAVRQDASLLGGVVVKIGSFQIDGSLAGKLSRLALKLKAA